METNDDATRASIERLIQALREADSKQSTPLESPKTITGLLASVVILMAGNIGVQQFRSADISLDEIKKVIEQADVSSFRPDPWTGTQANTAHDKINQKIDVIQGMQHELSARISRLEWESGAKSRRPGDK